MTRRVSVSMSPSTYSPLCGAAATWPEKKANTPARGEWQWGAGWKKPGAVRRSIMRGRSAWTAPLPPARASGARRRGGGGLHRLQVERLGDQLVRPAAGLVVVRDRHDD